MEEKQMIKSLKIVMLAITIVSLSSCSSINGLKELEQPILQSIEKEGNINKKEVLIHKTDKKSTFDKIFEKFDSIEIFSNKDNNNESKTQDIETNSSIENEKDNQDDTQAHI